MFCTWTKRIVSVSRDSYACERLTYPYVRIMYISHIRRLCYNMYKQDFVLTYNVWYAVKQPANKQTDQPTNIDFIG